jgi:tRNA threonylcarbamoyladenosine biosynthesis protein TsaE
VSGPQAGTPRPRDACLDIRTRSASETRRIGEALGVALGRRPDAGTASTVITLTGPLGAGKTCFVQGLARGLGVHAAVRSPTFTLIHELRGTVPLRHVDLYRLAAPDLETLGLEELIDRPGVTAIEWGERAEGYIPAEHLEIAMQFGAGACERGLKMIPRGSRYEQIVAVVGACASCQ